MEQLSFEFFISSKLSLKPRKVMQLKKISNSDLLENILRVSPKMKLTDRFIYLNNGVIVVKIQGKFIYFTADGEPIPASQVSRKSSLDATTIFAKH